MSARKKTITYIAHAAHLKKIETKSFFCIDAVIEVAEADIAKARKSTMHKILFHLRLDKLENKSDYIYF